MMRRALLAAFVLAGHNVATLAPALAADTEVTIDNFTFSPAQLTVAVGTRVTWINRDDIPHTVVSRDDPRSMKSPPLDTDESFAFSFAKPGTYQYFCSLHPHMQGTVVVQ
jgi:plastocyanin